MAARLTWAIGTALVGGAWLWRRAATSASESENPRTARWLRGLVLAWCGVWALLWLLIAGLRLRYPFELEWIGGAMRDHCERVLSGRPLYVAPGSGWFPYEYPPLYFWVSALLMRLLHDPSFLSMRLVSLLSTLGCAVLLYAWVHKCITAAGGTTGKVWGAIAAGIFLATYRFTGAWYDAERLDMLFLFLALLGGYWLTLAEFAMSRKDAKMQSSNAQSVMIPRFFPERRHGSDFYLILAAAAFWLAFLTKQQAVLYIVGGAGALLWRRERRNCVIFALAALLLCAGSVDLLNRETQGWFGYYCFQVPLANGIRLHLAAQYLFGDLPLYAPLIVLILLALLLIARQGGQPVQSRAGGAEPIDPDLALSSANKPKFSTVLTAMTIMGLLGSLLSRAHWGGDQNVLMAGFIALTVAGCVLAGRLEASKPVLRVPLYALVLAQLLTLVYRPDAQLPTAAGRAAGEQYAAAVRRLEQEGEVLCLDHGGLTHPRHFQIMGLLDVVGTEKGLPPDLDQALRGHRYAAIVMDAEPTPGGALSALTENYAPSECLNISASWTVTGFPTPNPDRRVWVLRPIGKKK